MGRSSIIRMNALVLVLTLAVAFPVQAAAPAAPQTSLQAAPQAGCIIYVNAAATAGGDGTTWATAYQDLQAALTAATSGCQIWVAKGTYVPTSGTDQSMGFSLQTGVAIYGGFIGSETDLTQRSWQNNPTILSGEIGAAGIGDNSYHVVFASGVNNTAALDGFTITAGNAGTSNGGGMYSTYSSPVLANLTFSNNSAREAGGLYIDHGNPTLVNVSFINNTASWFGGMENYHSSPAMTNIVFANNSATNEGGGLGDQYGAPTLNDVTFYGNSAPTGNGIYNDLSSSPVINNSILWGNNSQVVDDASSTATISYSDVQGGCPTGATCVSILNQDPLFVDVTHADLHLKLTSPAIDAGNNTLLPTDTLDINHNGNTTETLPLDRDGKARLVDIASVTDTGAGTAPIVDMGAYEARDRIYISRAAAGLNNGSTWTDAYTNLQNGLASAVTGSQIWVAKGTYKPSTSFDRTVSFQLKSGVAVYGGFSGVETALSSRYLRDNPTTLTGFLGMIPGRPPVVILSQHVVSATGVDNTAVLDGFTITSGNADATAADPKGGGIYLNGSYPTLSNLVIEDSSAVNGGGMAVTGSASYPVVLTNVVLYANSTPHTGGQNGGAIYDSGTSLALINVTFDGNSAKGSGGGIYQNAGTVSMENDILWGDTGSGGELVNNTGNAGNLHVDYSLISGCNPSGSWNSACGTNGGHNLGDKDPTFVNASSGDLHLRAGSPAVNQGSNAQVLSGTTTDLETSPRIMGGTVDLGAYEQPVYVYVNASASGGTHDGKSWATAYTHLQDGLASALSTATSKNWVEVWVAKGTYKPSDSGDRTAGFNLYADVMIYGGFSSSETARVDRSWTANPTILSGDLNGDDGPGFANNAENSYNVVKKVGSGNIVLDGFTITGGNANGSGTQQYEGGGLTLDYAFVTLNNLVITGNYALYAGGGLYAGGLGSETINNVIISGNATGHEGGGLYNENNTVSLTNAVFFGNAAGDSGGGINNYRGTLKVTNATFSGNAASQHGGAIYTNRDLSTMAVQNSVMWGNRRGTAANELDSDYLNPGVVGYSLIQGCKPGGSWNTWCGSDGGNNLTDKDPLIVDTAHGNLRLHAGSPAVDAGNDALVADIPTDLAGNDRIADAHVDLGAYELTHFYVNSQATGGNYGTSWADAYTDLQSALTGCTADCEIWVAKGTYKPTSGTDRSISFQLKSGVAIYGGFVGTETSLSRAYSANPTILSGDLLGDDGSNFANNGDNSYHVVAASGVDHAAILDGFTISAGNANGSAPDNSGAGLLIQGGAGPSLNNVIISYNTAAGLGGGVYSANTAPYFHWMNIQDNHAQSGAGMASAGGNPILATVFFTWNIATQSGGGLYDSNSNPTLTDASFAFNQAASGGALANSNSSPTLLSSSFVYNSATNGAGVYNLNSAPAITDSILYKNSASSRGGVLFDDSSSPKLTNVSMANNTATASGGGLFDQNGSSPLIQNSILWDDTSGEVANNGSSDKPTFTYSLVQGCKPGGTWNASCGLTDGSDLADADPQFANLANSNLRVLSNSPAIDAGSDALASGQATDLAGDPRISGSHVDLGAYELMHRYVDGRATGSNDGSSWANAFTNLQSALALNDYDVEIWVAKGTYKPAATTDRTIPFSLRTGQIVFGGFAGSETLRSQRDISANLTVLSGDLKGDDGPNFANNSDNSYAVVSDLSSDNSPILDGFTITGGNGNLPASQGGGIRIIGTSPNLSNLTITGNYATNGGGIYESNGRPFLQEVIVSGNAAAAGAGMYLSKGYPTVADTLIVGNHASGNGGGVYADNTAPAYITSVTMNGNSAASGGGLYVTDSAIVTLINDLFWGDTPGEVTADQSNGATQLGTSYSLIGGCFPSGVWNTACQTNNGHNLADVDPLFVAPLQGNLSLRKTSPAIDKGYNTAINNLQITIDLAGNPRIQSGTVDLGAYEYVNLPPTLSDFARLVMMQTDVSFSQADFTTNFKDSNGDSLVSVTITALPVHGTLYLGSDPVALNQVIPAASLGSLHYTPAQRYIGMDSFAWNASDGALSAARPASVVITLIADRLFVPLVVKN